MMSFSYHQLEDEGIERIGSVQEADHPGDSIDDPTFSPQKPLLPSWPRCVGLLEIVVGFICAGLGAVYIFLVPFLVDSDAMWYLDERNSYGAALWSGVMLVLAGSLAVRASKFRTVYNVDLFYLVSAFALIFNLAMLILIICCLVRIAFFDKVTEVNLVQNYTAIAIVSYVFCVLGLLLLGVATARYFMSTLFGEVQLVKSFLYCCCPCCMPDKLPPSQASSNLSMNSDEPNMIV